MSVKITEMGHAIKIDFAKHDAIWALLVIDDRYDIVKDMIFGATSKFTSASIKGIPDRFLEESAVDDFWSQYAATGEIFEKSLLLLPWALYDTDMGSITFSPFPDNIETLKETLGFAGNADSFTRVVACLLDVVDESANPPKERFTATCNMLDEMNHPKYMRARFTFGGTVLPGMAHIPCVTKDLTSGNEPLKERVRNWYYQVQGVPSAEFFHELTGSTKGQDKAKKKHCDCCHDPTDILKASFNARKRISHLLSKCDCCGVWKWAEQLVANENVSKYAGHRWLCAKAFQTTTTNSTVVPLTAVIGICEGAIFLETKLENGYSVTSQLLSLNLEEDETLFALGALDLIDGSGLYVDFALALRDWIVHPEQFKKRKGRISSAKIEIDDNIAVLEFKYTASLPDDIFEPPASSRIGSVTRTWKRLAAFAKEATHANDCIRLIFNRHVPKMPKLKTG